MGTAITLLSFLAFLGLGAWLASLPWRSLAEKSLAFFKRQQLPSSEQSAGLPVPPKRNPADL